LSGLGFVFSVEPTNTDEGFSSGLSAEKIPLYLAEKKSEAFYREIEENELLITADTIVWHNNTVLNKPLQYSDALHMLQTLSGGMHEVFTGVCLRARHKTELFFDVTKVYFKKLSFEEIDYYIKNYNVYDKAGAYGAQDWIGLVGIDRLEGSYFNVMGLPVHKVYQALKTLQ